jgi:hypothetical protein
MDKLAEFVLRLASEPQTLAQFKANPDASAQAAGLSTADIAALKSGDAAVIRQSVAGAASDAGASDIVIVVVLAPAPNAPAQSLLSRFRMSAVN